jgi:thiamine kinase-like enzyme
VVDADASIGAGFPPEVAARLRAALSRLPYLVGQPLTVVPLEGGLTNLIVKVAAPARTVVLRLSSSDGDLLAIDRDLEEVNSRRAADSGAGPAVLERLPDLQVLVVEWVPGRTLAPDDLRDDRMLARVARVCRTLHAGPRFIGDFDMFAVQRRYLDIVTGRGFRLPARYLDLMPQVEQIAAALAVRRVPTVPCNNDLLAANFIDDGSRLWVIDYEYGGNNDPCFELGNIWQEAELPAEHIEALVDLYYGSRIHHRVARARLLGLMARYGWTLWASIQTAISPIDFDFWSWGMAKYERALEDFDSPAFPRLLQDAQRPD